MSDITPLRTDEFGFGASLIASFESFCTIQRGSGRTTKLLESLKPGDVIVTMSGFMGKYYDREITKRGIGGITILVVSEDSAADDLMHRMLEVRASARRPLRFRFDEQTIEKIMRREVLSVATMFDRLQRRCSNSEAEFEQFAHDKAVEARYQRSIDYVRT